MLGLKKAFGKKEISKLIPIKVMDKTGRVFTVYKKPAEVDSELVSPIRDIDVDERILNNLGILHKTIGILQNSLSKISNDIKNLIPDVKEEKLDKENMTYISSYDTIKINKDTLNDFVIIDMYPETEQVGNILTIPVTIGKEIETGVQGMKFKIEAEVNVPYSKLHKHIYVNSIKISPTEETKQILDRINGTIKYYKQKGVILQ